MSRKANTATNTDSKQERALVRLAARGDREAYLHLFLTHLPQLDRYVRHEIRTLEASGELERGLIDRCAIVDQVYIAGLGATARKPSRLSFLDWLCFLAEHIIRQQARLEQAELPEWLTLEHTVAPDGNVDTEFWEFYQPDDVFAVEDLVGDRNGDPEQELERRETAAEIEQRIADLPPDLCELLRLRLLEGLHAAEIAALKNQSPLDVQQSLREACQMLRASLNPPGA